MSRWNHPVYNLAGKLMVAAIVAVFIALYALATGSPMTGSVLIGAGVAAALATVLAFSVRRLGGETA